MAVICIKDAAQLENTLQQEKVVLFLFAGWSVYPMKARPKFKAVAERFIMDHPVAQVGFYTMEEDADFAARWLEASNIEGLPGKYPMGWGAILWLQRGQVVHKLLRSDNVPESRLYQETLKVFDLANDGQ